MARGKKATELDWRSMDSVSIDMAYLAPMLERGGASFPDGPIITQVYDLSVKLGVPLNLTTTSCMKFSENFGHFITCDAPERCLVKPYSAQVASFSKEPRRFTFDPHHVRALCLEYMV